MVENSGTLFDINLSNFIFHQQEHTLHQQQVVLVVVFRQNPHKEQQGYNEEAKPQARELQNENVDLLAALKGSG